MINGVLQMMALGSEGGGFRRVLQDALQEQRVFRQPLHHLQAVTEQNQLLADKAIMRRSRSHSKVLAHLGDKVGKFETGAFNPQVDCVHE